jgi:hypothetical protein
VKVKAALSARLGKADKWLFLLTNVVFTDNLGNKNA